MSALAWAKGHEQPDAPPLDEPVTVSGILRAAGRPLGDYLGDVRGYLTRYVAFPSEHEPVAVALWVAHCYLVDDLDTSPILAISSAEMRSGKSRLLDCLETLVPNPRRMVLPSEAVFYTVLARRPRATVLLDELDVIFGKRMPEKYEGIRGVLNSGNRRGSPVLRVGWEGRKRIEEEFDVFGPKAIAGIGEPPATVADRSIPIRMRRRAPDEPVARFRQRRAEAEAKAIEHPDWETVPLVPDVPDVLDGLSDRAMDSWEPLLAIADAAGGGWSQKARAAAVALSGGDDVNVSTGVLLLEDVYALLRGSKYLKTQELLDGLHDLEDSPWGDFYGSPLKARRLATLLEPYGIAPRQERIEGAKVRGYFRQDFEDAWRRYVSPPTETTGTTGTTGTGERVEDDYPASAYEGDEE